MLANSSTAGYLIYDSKLSLGGRNLSKRREKWLISKV